jgi:hypothetical protein
MVGVSLAGICKHDKQTYNTSTCYVGSATLQAHRQWATLVSACLYQWLIASALLACHQNTLVA